MEADVKDWARKQNFTVIKTHILYILVFRSAPVFFLWDGHEYFRVINNDKHRSESTQESKTRQTAQKSGDKTSRGRVQKRLESQRADYTEGKSRKAETKAKLN